jgi:transcriptional regulator with XRE-family HTH domain
MQEDLRYNNNRYAILGEAIRQARKEAGIFRNDLAKLLGRSYTCVNLWERGDRRIQIDDLEKIALILNKPINYFFDFKTTDIINKQETKSEFLTLVEDTILEMEEKNFPIKLYYDKQGNKIVTNVNRLFTKLIMNASQSEKEIHFDKKLGGVENETQLVDFLFEHLKKE